MHARINSIYNCLHYILTMEVLELPSDKSLTTISNYICMLYLQIRKVSVSTNGEPVHLNY
jgi:hypothetical protein